MLGDRANAGRVIVSAMLCVAAACSSGSGTDQPSTPLSSAPPGSTAGPTSGGARVVDVIDIGGGEVLGLAVHDDAVWAISFQQESISKIDPDSGAIVVTERLGSGAATVLSAGPQLWVAGYGMGSGAKLLRIDPATGDAVADVSLGEVCCDLASGAGRIWAIDPRGDLVGVDPMRQRVTERYAVPFDPSVHTNAVFGGSSMWVGSDGDPLVQVDPTDGTVVHTIETGGGPPFLAHRGLVWGAAPDLIWAVDVTTGDVVRSIPLHDSMEVISLGIGLGSIWVGIRHPGYIGAVLQLDPSTGRVVTDLSEVEIPARIAIGFGSVWVSDSGSSSVYRIAPS